MKYREQVLTLKGEVRILDPGAVPPLYEGASADMPLGMPGKAVDVMI